MKNSSLNKQGMAFMAALVFVLICACSGSGQKEKKVLRPLYITDTVSTDSDDPAIWIHPESPEKSLILGTDKTEGSGALYVFDIYGKEIPEKRIDSLDRPNNVAIATNIFLSGSRTDIAFVTERMKGQLRAYSVPDMKPVDGGGLAVFEDENPFTEVMGVATYRKSAGEQFVIVSRKAAPDSTRYLHQYKIEESGGVLSLKLVRKFGMFEGSTEIEAIAVDDELGYVYYSDEGFGIRKYYADPEKGNEELAVFGRHDFTEDREGIAIYSTGEKTGYLLISDQQGHNVNVYKREGTAGDPHQHTLLAQIKVQARDTDGLEVYAGRLSEEFPKGILVMMSDNKTFELYNWQDIEKKILKN